MAFVSSSPTLLTPESTPDAVKSSETALIDISARSPVFLLLGSSVAWLLFSSVLGVINSWKLHSPGFLAGQEFLTYGRTHPAQTNSFIYGWGVNVALAIILWLMARLSRGEIHGGRLITAGVLFWNLGVALGIGGILLGDSTAFTWLEMPRYASPVIFAAYSMIAAWAFLAHRSGRSKTLYVSQWYLFAAVLCFPWIYTVAQVLLVFAPVRGTLQSVVNAWFVFNMQSLWFTPVALAIIYYFLPKLLGRPIYGYYLAPLAFWWLIVFSSFGGAASLIGAPVPAWVQTAGIASVWMLLVPLFILVVNFVGTIVGGFRTASSFSSLRFIGVAILALIISILATVGTSVRAVAEVVQFTFATNAITHLGLYGIFSMAVFGAVYFIVPRLTSHEWRSPALTNVHFWAATLGLVVSCSALLLAGLRQGQGINDSAVPFLDVIARAKPMLVVASCGTILTLIGSVAFSLNILSAFNSVTRRDVLQYRQTSKLGEVVR